MAACSRNALRFNAGAGPSVALRMGNVGVANGGWALCAITEFETVLFGGGRC